MDKDRFPGKCEQPSPKDALKAFRAATVPAQPLEPRFLAVQTGNPCEPGSPRSRRAAESGEAKERVHRTNSEDRAGETDGGREAERDREERDQTGRERRGEKGREMEAETARGKKGESQHLGDPLPLRIQLITELHKRTENTESETEPPEKEQRRRAHRLFGPELGEWKDLHPWVKLENLDPAGPQVKYPEGS